MKSKYKTTEIVFLKARDFDEWKITVEDTTNKATIYLDKEDMYKLMEEIFRELELCKRLNTGEIQ